MLKSCIRIALVVGVLFLIIFGLLLLTLGDEIKAFAEDAWSDVMGSGIGDDGPPPGENSGTRDEIDLSWEVMATRDVRYSVSKVLKQGVPYRFRVYVGQSAVPEQIRGGSHQAGNFMGETKLGTWMTVLMQANTNHFSLRSLSSDTQVAAGDTLRWEWEAVPIKSGTVHLDVLVSTKFSLSDGTVLARDTLSKQIECQVERSLAWLFMTFLGNHWKWILGSPLIAGLAVWIWRLFLSSKTREPKGRRAGF